MSETAAAPAPNIAATPPVAQPATQGVTPGTLSLRDAASLLGKRRQEAAREAQNPTASQPPANSQTPPAANDGAPEATPSAESKPGQQGKPDALAAALGQPGQEFGTPPPAANDALAQQYTIDGRAYSQDELKSAIAAHADYTKKTQQLAAQQKQVVEHAQQLQRLSEQHKAFETVLPLLQPELNRLAQSFQMVPPPSAALLQTDPNAYLQQLAQHNDSRAELDRLQQIMGVQTQAQQRAMAEAVDRANHVLGEKYPVWRDPAQRAELQNTIVEWATTKGGYSREELKGLADHRHLEALMKAAMYDRLSEGARTRAPAQMQPAYGSAPPPPRPAMLREREEAFNAKPDWRTGAALLSARRAQTQR